jgi:preprotein translocase subunit YajC
MIPIPVLDLLQETPPTGAAPQTAPSTGAPPPGAPAAEPMGNLNLLVPKLGIYAIFYFVMIGPERKQRKKREEMLKLVKKGDKVMTTGGMFGTVAAVADDSITLLVADGVRLKFTRAAIQSVEEPSADAGDKPAESKKG